MMLPTHQQQLFTPPTYTKSGSCSPTIAASQDISELAEFASSMVYLMWHSRKTTKALQSNTCWSTNAFGNDLAYLMWQSRKPTFKYSPLGGSDQSSLYSASPAFKKFCFQVGSFFFCFFLVV
jgi:hypothetical protein